MVNFDVLIGYALGSITTYVVVVIAIWLQRATINDALRLIKEDKKSEANHGANGGIKPTKPNM